MNPLRLKGRGLGLPAAALGAELAMTALFALRGPLSARACLQHLVLTIFLAGAAAFPLLMAARLMPQRKTLLAWLLVLSAFAFAELAWVPALFNAIAYYAWGDSANRGLILRLLPEIAALSRDYGVSTPSLVALVFAPGLLSAAGAWALRRRALESLEALAPSSLGGLMLLAAPVFPALFLLSLGAQDRLQLFLLEARGECLASAYLCESSSAISVTEPRRQELLADAAERAKLKIQVPARQNLILITLDAGRFDHMSLYGYSRKTTPFLDSLQAAGGLHKVERAYAHAPATLGALVALYMSRSPRDMSENELGLGELLKAEGFKTHFFLSGTHLWYGLEKCYGPHPDTFFHGDSHPRSFDSQDDRYVVDRLKELPASSGQPAFLGFHLMSTHDVGRTRPEFKKFLPEKAWPAFIQGHLPSTAAEAAELCNDYDNRMLQADDTLRQIFGLLKAKGYLKNSVLVVTADHGEALGEHGVFGHGRWLYESVIRVPIIFWSDRSLNLKQGDFAAASDIGPTFLDLAGLPKPSTWQGISLVGDKPRTLIASECEAGGGWGCILLHGRGRLIKYYRILSPDSAKIYENVYDVLADPGETADLAPQMDREAFESLRQLAAANLSPLE